MTQKIQETRTKPARGLMLFYLTNNHYGQWMGIVI